MFEKTLKLREYRRYKKMKFGTDQEMVGIYGGQSFLQKKDFPSLGKNYKISIMNNEEFETSVGELGKDYYTIEPIGCVYCEDFNSYQVIFRSLFKGDDEIVVVFDSKMEYEEFNSWLNNIDNSFNQRFYLFVNEVENE